MGMLDQAAAQQAPMPPQAATPAPAPAPAPVEAPAEAPQIGLGEGEEVATPEEQAEFERALEAVEQVLYTDDELSQSVLDQIDAEDKVGSVVKVSILLIQQVDEKADLDEVVIPQITEEVVGRIMELGEKVLDVQYTDEDAKAILGATWEGVVEVFGYDEESFAEVTAGMSEQDLVGQVEQYKQMVGPDDAPMQPEQQPQQPQQGEV